MFTFISIYQSINIVSISIIHFRLVLLCQPVFLWSLPLLLLLQYISALKFLALCCQENDLHGTLLFHVTLLLRHPSSWPPALIQYLWNVGYCLWCTSSLFFSGYTIGWQQTWKVSLWIYLKYSQESHLNDTFIPVILKQRRIAVKAGPNTHSTLMTVSNTQSDKLSYPHLVIIHTVESSRAWRAEKELRHLIISFSSATLIGYASLAPRTWRGPFWWIFH